MKNLWPPAAMAVVALAYACGGGEKGAAPAGPPPGAKRVDLATAGRLSGRVVLDGAAPANPSIKLEADPFCIRAHPTGATFERYVVDNGGLENVFVYVKDGLGQYYFDVPTQPVEVDQQGCRYVPHVFGVRVGQPVKYKTSDGTLHNVHAMPKGNQEFNFGLQMPGESRTRTFTSPEVMVPFKCDVHNWMSAYAGVVSHPYFAVTASGGTFELKDLPAGTYTIEAWHEKLGTETQSVTVGDKESKEMTFTFKAPAAATN